jgi:alpha-D-xyloside xylohydrolase
MIDAPLGTPAVFLRAGHVVPMLRPTIDSLSPTSVPGTGPGQVDSYATTAGELYVRTAPGQTTQLDLFDGTQLIQSEAEGLMLLSITPGDEFVFGARFEVLALGQAPISIVDTDGPIPELDAMALEQVERGWTWDGAVLIVKVGAGAQSVTMAL